MSDELPLFEPAAPQAPEGPAPMSQRQRAVLRELFGRLGITDARGQFDLIEALTGRRLKSVQDLDAPRAQVLTIQLTRRLALVAESDTGNAWADREEDTWIDKL